MQEIMKEVKQFTTDKPMTQAEFDKTKQNTVMGMAGMWETNNAVNASARNLIKYNLKDDYWKTYSQRVQNLALKDVQTVAKTIVQPNNLGWFLAGDAEKVMPGLQQLGKAIAARTATITITIKSSIRVNPFVLFTRFSSRPFQSRPFQLSVKSI